MKTNLRNLLMLAIIVVITASCSKSSFDYIGKTYPPTTDPEIFMRDQDVEQDYEVMGKVIAEVPYNKKLKYVQNKVMNVARQNGADAVLFSDVGIRSTGYSKASGGGSTGGRKGRIGGNVSKVKDNEVKTIEAVLIKYKDK